MVEKLTKEIFLTYHCFCTRKDIQCLDIILEDSDVVKALTEYVSYAAIEKLVLGAPSRSGFMRKFRADVPSNVSKTAPDFCTVYVISKGKVSTLRNATRPAPNSSPLLDQVRKQNADYAEKQSLHSASVKTAEKSIVKPRTSVDGGTRSPYHGTSRASLMRAFGDFSESDTDISFVSSGRPSTDRNSSLMFDSFIDSTRNSRISTSTDHSLGSMRSAMRWNERG
ncbi:hypothetical protein COLO4_38279 [Corchorus olitorius]|uniref:RING-type E3 ubiquitin transferase n=1 Tax=Corchorus olitorius TaxID=93759 RepID=A0A1R3FVR1_9ROSI|nr:hypothetical protein COLO4_38279 [Corchorus olitorius]